METMFDAIAHSLRERPIILLGILGGVLFFDFYVTWGPLVALALTAVYTALAAAGCQCWGMWSARRSGAASRERLARDADAQHAALLGGDLVTGTFGDCLPPEMFLQTYRALSRPPEPKSKKIPASTLMHHVHNIWVDFQKLDAMPYKTRAQYEQQRANYTRLAGIAGQMEMDVPELVARAQRAVKGSSTVDVDIVRKVETKAR